MRLRAPLQRERAAEAYDADDVIAMEMREEDLIEREGDAVFHHLPLSTLAAVEQQRFSLASEGEGGNIPLHRRAGG